MFSRTKFNSLIEWSSCHWRRFFNLLASSSLELVTWTARDKSKATFDWVIMTIYVLLVLCVTNWSLSVTDFLIWSLELIKSIEIEILINRIWSNCLSWLSNKTLVDESIEIISSLNLIEISVISISRFLKVNFAFISSFSFNSTKRSSLNIKMLSVCISINSNNFFWLMKSRQRSYVDFVILRFCLRWSWYVLNQYAFAFETS